MTKNQKIEISERLYDFCYSCIYELAEAFNNVLRSGKKHGRAFYEVMDILKVPENERENILFGTFVSTESAGRNYNKLSPANQFIVTIPGYVSYCLRNKLPDDEELRQESEKLLILEGVPRYLQEQLGVKISQEVKGALWCPRPVWLSVTIVKVLFILFVAFLVGLLYFLRESFVHKVSSYIMGILILIGWTYSLISKAYYRPVSPVHSFIAWQWNILPLPTAACLFLTGDIIFLLLPVLFCFVPLLLRSSLFDFLACAMSFILSIVYSWHIGVRICELLDITFAYSRLIFGIIGVIIIQVVCSLIFGFVTSLYERKF